MDTFPDSFEKPDFYLYPNCGGHSMKPNIKKEDYMLLQKSSHPDFSMQ